jgi:hypothetical protein
MTLTQKQIIELLQNVVRATKSNGKSEAKRVQSSDKLISMHKRQKGSPAITDVISTEEKGGSAHKLASPNSKSSKTNHDSLGAMQAFVGRRVAKYFNGEIFLGTVAKAIPDDEAESGFYFHVNYDDDDSEDFDKSELMDGIEL